MGPRVLWSLVTCYLTCILCRNVFGESTFAKVFASINDASEMDTKSIFETENIRLTKTQTNSDGITLKDDWSKPEILQDSAFVKSASETKILNTHRKARCSKYCIQKLRTGQERNNSFEDDNICISWFAGNTSEEVDFSLENNRELNVSRQISIDNKNSILLHNCQIYFDLDNIINIEKNSTNEHNKFSNLYFNHRNIEIARSFPNAISQFSKKLLHRTNLSGYTETNFHIDPNTSRIIINILGNITHAILAIPINGAVRRLGVIMSLAQTHSTKRVVIGARSLPSGEYCMKITGVENSKYDFDVIIFFETNKNNNGRNIMDITDNELIKEFNMFDKKKDFDESGRKYIDGKTAVINKTERFNKLEKENISTDQISSIFLTDFRIKDNLKSIFERSIEIKDQTNNDEETTIYELPVTFLSTEWNQFAVENITNYSTLHNNSLTNYSEFRNPQNTSKKIFDGKAFTIDQRQKIQMQTSEVTSLNEDVDMNTKSFAIENIPTKVNNSDYNQELSSDFTKNIHEDVFAGRNTLIDVNVNSNLIIAIGKRTHQVIFDVSNKCFLSVKYTINARSLSFRILNIYPTILWLHPGQTSQVTVDILIPPENKNTVDTITLFIEGTEMKKSVYVFVQNEFTKKDNVKPTIEYSFNSNCLGKTDKYRCEKTFWSADITVQDSDSGLQRIISTPNAIYPRKMFISGTTDPVEFYYFSTCCFTTVEITAIDVTNNQNTRMLDVTVWDNLSQGEIAAITLGALLLLLLLILLIIVAVRCFRKRNSHNLPYTQRYGSRPPARSE